jgi:hypothetical protein
LNGPPAKEAAVADARNTRTAHTTKHTEILELPENERNSLPVATLVAAFVDAGHAVHVVADGWLVCRWGMTKHCPDARALAAFGRACGVRG